MPVGTFDSVLKRTDVTIGTWNDTTKVFAAGGSKNAVKVVTRRSSTNSNAQTLTFGRIYGQSSANITATAIAVGGSTGTGCVLALDGTANDAVLIGNNATLSGSCGVYSNSDSPSALRCNNNCEIDGPTSVVGGESVGNNGTLKGPNVTGAAAATDPYAGVTVSAGACTTSTVVTGGTISAGHYCGGISISNNGSLTMNAGTYYIDNQFATGNNVTLNANASGGVTIVLNGTFALAIGNNAVINLTARSTGTFAGIALMGPRNSTKAVAQHLGGNNTQVTLQGVIYFPSQTLTLDNNVTLNAPLCAEVVADVLNFKNNAGLKMTCANTGVQGIGSSSKPHLVQ